MGRIMRFLLALVCILIGISTTQTQAQTRNSNVAFLLSGALEVGGDEIVEIVFDDGDTQSVRTGQGISLHAGGRFYIPSAPKLFFDATIGFKYVTTAADNAHIRLTRIPLKLTGSWAITDDISAGIGIVSHQNIQFKGDGIGPDMDYEADLGPRFEIAYRGIGLSYTILEYTDETNAAFSANSFGISYSYAFNR